MKAAIISNFLLGLYLCAAALPLGKIDGLGPSRFMKLKPFSGDSSATNVGVNDGYKRSDNKDDVAGTPKRDDTEIDVADAFKRDETEIDVADAF